MRGCILSPTWQYWPYCSRFPILPSPLLALLPHAPNTPHYSLICCSQHHGFRMYSVPLLNFTNDSVVSAHWRLPLLILSQAATSFFPNRTVDGL